MQSNNRHLYPAFEMRNQRLPRSPNKKQDKKLQLLNNTVDNFTPEGLAKTQDSMTEMVNKAKEVLNKLSR